MTLGEGIAYSAAWIAIAVCFVAYMKMRRPKHQHVWEERHREPVARSREQNSVVGYTSYCKCKECGEPRSFYNSVGG